MAHGVRFMEEMMAASSTELAWGSDLAHIASKLSAAPDVHSLLLTAAFQIRQVFNSAVAVFAEVPDGNAFGPVETVGVPKDEIWPARFGFDSAVVKRLDATTHTSELDVPAPERQALTIARS